MKNKKIKTVSIKLKPTKIESFESIVSNLVRWLKRKNINILMLTDEIKRIQKNCSQNILKSINFVEAKEFYNQADLFISFGGDGTFIGASRSINKKIPIFGINLGRLGFITEFSKNEFFDNLEDVLKGKFSTEKIFLFNAKIIRKGKVIHSEFFLNDCVINKNDIARMFHLNVECNGDHIYNLSGDGLIISSTKGSTAYSLAAGGPIVNPNVKAMLLTPICPHSLTYRPLVLEDKSKVSVKLTQRGEEVSITLDGQIGLPLSFGDEVIITKSSSKSISYIKNKERTYFQVLKEKFFHGR